MTVPSREDGEPFAEEVDIEVRYAETDAQGVVHHSNYVVWFELARTALCRHSGRSYAEIEQMGFNLVVTGVQARYRRAARYGDPVRVRCVLSRFLSRGLVFEYEVRCGDDLLATGETDHIWVDRESGRPCRVPKPLEDAFRRLAAT